MRRRLQRYHMAMGELSAIDEARLNRFVQSAYRFARGRPQVLRELARQLGGEATTLEETAESEADTEREQPSLTLQLSPKTCLKSRSCSIMHTPSGPPTDHPSPPHGQMRRPRV